MRVGRIGGDGSETDDARGFADLKLLSSGAILALPARIPQAWVLSLNGKILRRIGVDGGGPGEFRRPESAIQGAGDSLFVWDRVLARVSVFTPDGVFHRSYRVPSGAYVVTPLGGLKAAAVGHLTKTAPNQSFPPVHFLLGDSVEKSVGDAVRNAEAQEPLQLNRILLPYPGSLLVINRSYHYVVERWTTNGTLMSRLVREPEWFKPFDHYGGTSPSSPPSPFIAGAWVDDRDQLWVVGVIAAPTWKQGLADHPMKGEGGMEIYTIAHPDLYYQGFVEVFDLKRQTLVATSTLPIQPHYALGKGVVGVFREDPQFGRYVELYRVTMKSP